jgi:gentisate 1,2-dioxygenase
MPTLRAEFHRLRSGVRSVRRREVGSSVWQVFSGSGAFVADEVEYQLGPGDLFAIPSWVELDIVADDGLDLFRFSDAPIFEALHQYRTVATPR